MPPTIDVWAQVVTERMAGAPWLASLLRWTASTPDDVQVTPQATVAAMDEAGVDLALLSAWHGPSGPLITNEEVAEDVATAPERFRGVAAVDLRRPMDAVAQVRHWVGDVGFVGVRVVPWLWDLPPNDRRYYPVYVACAEAGVPLCTQIGHTGPLRRSEPGRLIPYLEDVLLDFPELTVVGGHVGHPWLDELHSLTVKFPNLHVDTSAYVLHRLPADFLGFLHGVGSDRTMFGTNWPMLTPSQCLAGLDQLGLDEEARAAFLGGTAARVFGL